MKRKKLFQRLYGWLLTVSMLMTFVPGFVLPASAKTGIQGSYTYKIQVKNADVRYAGTDGDVFCVVKTHSGRRIQKQIDSGANDFERNDCRTYSVELDCQPWEIKEIGIRNNGSDGMKVAWFKFKVPGAGWVIDQKVDAWIEKNERLYPMKSAFDRRIESRGNFDSSFSGTAYYSPLVTSGQSDKTMEWNGKVTDQYFNEYNMLDYYGAVGVTFSASGTNYLNGGSLTMSTLEGNSLAKVEQSSQGYNNKITLYTNSLLNYMSRNKIYMMKLKSELDYNDNTDEYSGYSKTYTIIRTGFELGDAVAVTPAYTPFTDNNFYNSNDAYSTFKIKIPVLKREHYDAAAIARSLASNISSKATTAKVYYDAVNTTGYVTPTSVQVSGNDIYLVCKTPR